MQNLAQNLRKFIKKDYFLRIQDSFSKRDLSANPIDGLTQNINIDLRTTWRQQTVSEICAICKNIFAFRILRNFASFIFVKKCEIL